MAFLPPSGYTTLPFNLRIFFFFFPMIFQTENYNWHLHYIYFCFESIELSTQIDGENIDHDLSLSLFRSFNDHMVRVKFPLVENSASYKYTPRVQRLESHLYNINHENYIDGQVSNSNRELFFFFFFFCMTGSRPLAKNKIPTEQWITCWKSFLD